jgi:dolichol-phosphate mannosyltransferase
LRSLVILPTYNEVENLPLIVEAVLAVDPGIDVLVVDDNSPDGTGRLADRLSDRDSRVKVIHREGKRGLGTAYLEGFKFGLARGYDLLAEMDADFSHRPEDLAQMLKVAASGRADVVIGSRNVPGGKVIGWSPLRQLISRGGSLYARRLLGLSVHDCTSGFKVFSREALEAIDLTRIRSNGYGFQVEVNEACDQAGLRVVEVPIVFPDRVQGYSKMSAEIALEAALVVLGLRLRRRRAAARTIPLRPAPGRTRLPSGFELGRRQTVAEAESEYEAVGR